MKKMVAVMVLLLCMTGCVACSGEKKAEKKKLTYTSEDYNRGNAHAFLPKPMMRTEEGHYYYSEMHDGFRFYDVVTGNEMYLCNKPECKHDGNAFCVATNDKYRILSSCLYSERIFAYVIVETDTQYRFEVISLSLDGAEMEEVATILELEKTGQLALEVGGEFWIHRNKVLLSMWSIGHTEMEDTHKFGTALLDLDTGEVSYLDEEPLSADNLKIQEVTAYGDWFYYCRKENKRYILHRYNIVTGTDETYRLLPGFQCNYAVLDENTVVYLRMDIRNFFVHHYDTGESEERKWAEWDAIYHYADGTTIVPGYDEDGNPAFHTVHTRIQDVVTDGTYLYALSDGAGVKIHKDGKINNTEYEAYIRIFDSDLQEIGIVNVYDAIEQVKPAGVEWELAYYSLSLRFLEDAIYLELCPKGDTGQWYVYRCNKEDFLNGTPEFSFVYRMDREQDGESLLYVER